MSDFTVGLTNFSHILRLITLLCTVSSNITLTSQFKMGGATVTVLQIGTCVSIIDMGQKLDSPYPWAEASVHAPLAPTCPVRALVWLSPTV